MDGLPIKERVYLFAHHDLALGKPAEHNVPAHGGRLLWLHDPGGRRDRPALLLLLQLLLLHVLHARIVPLLGTVLARLEHWELHNEANAGHECHRGVRRIGAEQDGPVGQ